MIRIPTILGIALGAATLALVNRSSRPPAAKGFNAVWVSPIYRAGSNYYTQAGWIGYWTTIPDGVIFNEGAPTV